MKDPGVITVQVIRVDFDILQHLGGTGGCVLIIFLHLHLLMNLHRQLAPAQCGRRLGQRLYPAFTLLM